MTDTSTQVLFWAPRILSLALCLFFGLFPPGAALLDFAIHLIPAAIVLVLTLLSWRREWIGGIAFIGLAALYAAVNWKGRLDWTLVVSGPLLIVGLLFFWRWASRSQLRV
jgi:Flp pilus assembly protein protease CpaA